MNALDNVVCVIATRNGERTIYETVRSVVRNGIKCIVVSNGSTDATAARASAAGADVVTISKGIGKPASLRAAVNGCQLFKLYRWIIVCDDDTILDDNFVDRALKQAHHDTACVVGNTQSLYPTTGRLSWNPLVAMRAMAFWRYAFLRKGKATLGAIDVIAGSNSMFRATVLSELLDRPSKLLVDDTQWLWEIQRDKMGIITYAHDAVANTQDPTSFKDWWKQEKRWLGGTFQGIIMGRPGTRRTWFDLVFLGQIADWILYVLSLPVLILFFLQGGVTAHVAEAAIAGTALWAGAAAVALRRPKLLLLLPAIYVLDIVYRIVIVRALVYAVRNPTIKGNLTWESPKRA